MRTFLMAAALGAAVLAVAPGGAQAQERCGPRENVVALLAARYGEARIAVGVADSGSLVEVFAAADGSTWTIVVTSPRGRSCMVAAGAGWQVTKPGRAAPET